MSTEQIQPTQAAKPATIRTRLESPDFAAAVAKALPKHLTPERFIRVAITTMTKTPKLAQCDQASFFGALLTLSQFGLEPDGRRAHLIPYGTTCQLVIDYKGLVEMAMRSGQVASIHADKVCEHDQFRVNRGQVEQHEIDYRKPRGAAYAYYALIIFKDGAQKSEVMTREEVDAIRKRSRAGTNGPWVTDYDEMAKKTVFKRASKWLPLSADVIDLMEKDDDRFDEIKRVGPVAEPAPLNPFELPETAFDINGPVANGETQGKGGES
jgi:recombination protein RecT